MNSKLNIGDSSYVATLQKVGYALLGLGVLGAAATVAISGKDRFFQSYVLGFAYFGGIGITALFFSMLQFLVQAGYSVSYRRIAEIMAGFVPFVGLLLLPIIGDVMSGHSLYHWASPEALQDPVIKEKSGYLNAAFFTGRLVFYALTWFMSYKFIVGNSIKQDSSDDVTLSKKNFKRSAPFILLFAMTSTFAGFDVLMSLDPHWFSTMFGVYFFAGNFVATLSVLTILVVTLSEAGFLKGYVTKEHYHDLGKLMFAFTVFWAYITFSQYFLIWYGNMPEETLWFKRRLENGWEVFGWALLFGHFMLPFGILLQQHVKKNPKVLLLAAGVILFMHFIDQSWVILPALEKNSSLAAAFGWQEITVWMGFAGLFVISLVQQFKKVQIVATNDPFLEESIHVISQ